MNAALRASSISAPLRTIFCGFSANGLKSFGLTAFPYLGSRMRLTARAMSDEVCWVQQEKAELDTQLIIAEMQGYAPYTRNEVSNHRTHGSHSQVYSGTSEVKALLSRLEKAQMHFCSDAQMPRSVKTALADLTDRVPAAPLTSTRGI